MKTVFDSQHFDVDWEVWVVVQTGTTPNTASDRQCIEVVFRKSSDSSQTRRLNLWVSDALLNDPTKPYRAMLQLCVSDWLGTSETEGERDCVRTQA
jgi:hypothetical protein